MEIIMFRMGRKGDFWLASIIKQESSNSHRGKGCRVDESLNENFSWLEKIFKFLEFYERRSIKVWKQVACKGRAEENIVVLCFSGWVAGEQTGNCAGVWRADHSQKTIHIRAPVSVHSIQNEQTGLWGNEQALFLKGVQVPVWSWWLGGRDWIDGKNVEVKARANISRSIHASDGGCLGEEGRVIFPACSVL